MQILNLYLAQKNDTGTKMRYLFSHISQIQLMFPLAHCLKKNNTQQKQQAAKQLPQYILSNPQTISF